MTRPLARGALASAAFRRLQSARAPLLFLDVDGTLAPLVDRPDRARVPPATGRILSRLRRTGARIVLVSGRSVPGVRRIAPIPVDAILGDHGARLWRSGHTTPWLPAHRSRIRSAARLVRRWIEGKPGLILEEKDRSLAIHLRLSRTAGSVAPLARMLREAGFRVLLGHRVLDVQLPRVNKGEAVRRWIARSPRRADAILYAGDDTTDQDAFAALPEAAISIAVGPRTSGARFRTRDPVTFAAWLRRLALAREGR
jgi:trehalose 6-phosphate phosphatase